MQNAISGWWLGLIMMACSGTIIAQPCTSLGQNPETAFPVCGTAVFTQSSVNICGNTPVPSRCPGNLFTDKNPYWYKFTCFQSGTLGFTIRPNNLGDDYDWQLFDVTGRNVRDVYTDVNMFVACNWSGDPGITGASAAGTSLVRCEGPGVPLFSAMPLITQGRQYLLLVSHFTDSQSGYSLTFGGGTASITDPTEPHVQSAFASCDGAVISVKLNKKMKCSSLVLNGSDFTLSPGTRTIISAVGIGCNSSFDTDSIVLTLSGPLTPGLYNVTMANGNDGNTLLDNCDRAIPEGETVPLNVFPIEPTPMDSLTPPGCAPAFLDLVFRKNIRCTSIAADGSDFSITGPYPVSITGASGFCGAGVTRKIRVQLASPMQRAGTFQLTLRRGSDGNTLVDECSQESLAGQQLGFRVSDTVNADFQYTINKDCTIDVVNYSHNGANGVNSWLWQFGADAPNSSLQNPSIAYTVFGIKTTSLIVSNGVCSDTSRAQINLDNYLEARIDGPLFICPTDRPAFRDNSIGNVRSWNWDLGNGNTSNVRNPLPQTYTLGTGSYDVTIRLIVTDDIGCKDTATLVSKVVSNCTIDIPSAFTPNNDGLNDFLYPLNAFKAKDLKFSVFNRFGQRIFYTENWLNKWNGYFKGKPADTGTYVWMLQYTEIDTNKAVFKKGSVLLLR